MKIKPPKEYQFILKEDLIYGIYIDNRLIYVGTTNDIINRSNKHLHNCKQQQYISVCYEILYKCILLGKFPIFKILAFGSYIEEDKYIKNNKNRLLINIFVINKYIKENFNNTTEPDNIKQLYNSIHNSNIMYLINQCNQIKLCKTKYFNSLIY